MEGLCREYMELLGSDKAASDKFWELEERIKTDRKSPGVILRMSKRETLWNVAALIRDKAITEADLDGFSDEFREAVDFLAKRL